MKAEDLMRGDWVYLFGAPCRVKDIVDDGVINYEKDVTPIQLTPEILEKNGFGFIDMYNGEFYSEWTGWWILEGLELGCCDNLKFPVFFNIADTNVKVNYVHELQHALKFCKIEKEVIL